MRSLEGSAPGKSRLHIDDHMMRPHAVRLHAPPTGYNPQAGTGKNLGVTGDDGLTMSLPDEDTIEAKPSGAPLIDLGGILAGTNLLGSSISQHGEHAHQDEQQARSTLGAAIALGVLQHARPQTVGAHHDHQVCHGKQQVG